MTWLWDTPDMYDRVAFARSISPTDLSTLIARWVVGWTTKILAFALYPLDYVARYIGRAFLVFVIGFMILIVLTIVWFPIWAALIGSSWLWLRYYWARPFLLLPGIALAILAHIYLMLVPDPQKQQHYFNMPGQWPLTWHLWRPPSEYYEPQQSPPPGPQYRAYQP